MNRSKLALRAYIHFWSLPIERQRTLLWQYVMYVEDTIVNEVGDPFLFLQWYLFTEPGEPEDTEEYPDAKD